MSSNGFGGGWDGVIKIDNAQGVLTDISAYCTGVALPMVTRTLDVRALASANDELLAVGNGAILNLQGNYHQIIDSILYNAKGNTRSLEYYPIGTEYPYYSGEVLGIDYQPAGSMGSLAGWSFTASVQGALTRTAPQIASLVSHWKFDESSGSRADSHGSNTLTDNNTVTSATGLLDKAAVFTAANSESLSIADNASTSIGLGISFAFAGWLKFTSKSALMTVLGKYAGTTEYTLRYENGTDRLTWYVHNGTILNTLTDSVLGSPATGTWYFVFCGYDATLQKSFLQINNGTAQYSGTHTGAQDSTNAFTFGAQSGGGAYLDGQLDGWSFWKGRVPGAAEMTILYNGGAGFDYPF